MRLEPSDTLNNNVTCKGTLWLVPVVMGPLKIIYTAKSLNDKIVIYLKKKSFYCI